MSKPEEQFWLTTWQYPDGRKQTFALAESPASSVASMIRAEIEAALVFALPITAEEWQAITGATNGEATGQQ